MDNDAAENATFSHSQDNDDLSHTERRVDSDGDVDDNPINAVNPGGNMDEYPVDRVDPGDNMNDNGVDPGGDLADSSTDEIEDSPDYMEDNSDVCMQEVPDDTDEDVHDTEGGPYDTEQGLEGPDADMKDGGRAKISEPVSNLPKRTSTKRTLQAIDHSGKTLLPRKKRKIAKVHIDEEDLEGEAKEPGRRWERLGEDIFVSLFISYLIKNDFAYTGFQVEVQSRNLDLSAKVKPKIRMKRTVTAWGPQGEIFDFEPLSHVRRAFQHDPDNDITFLSA